MTLADLEAVRAWRNLPDVRASMFTRHEISQEEHAAFFARALRDPTKRYLICSDAAGGDFGLASFVSIDANHGTAEWGFYRNDRPGVQAGSWLGVLALDAAFDDLGLVKVSADVLDWNDRSLTFHERLGFLHEGTFRAHHLRDGVRHDVHRLAVLRDDWVHHRRHVVARLTGSAPPEADPITVGQRAVHALDATSDLATGRLIDAATAILESLAVPGRDVRVDRVEARRLGGPAVTDRVDVTTRVCRRIGPSLTIAFEVRSGPTARPLLVGAADLTLEEEPA
jgi:UDP-4-amino-4,6-dideoxy-N-acetyl-beta-L-altrosamine N-acetyltransferase